MKSSLHRPGGVLLAGVLVSSVFAFMPAANAADGTISGTVTGSGAPLGDASVQAYVFEGGSWGYFDNGFAAVNPDGTYTLSLPPGDYRLGFDDYSGGFVGEFYLDAATVEDADTITVGDGQARVLDADLATASHITGTVTGPGGTGLELMSVAAYQQYTYDGFTYWQTAKYADTDANGVYDLGGLAPGTYRIEFADYAFDPTYATEYYQNQASVLVAQDVTVGATETRAGVDAQMAAESTISGTVTDAASAPLADTDVYAYVKAGDEWDFRDWATTDSAGRFTLDGLPTGTYKVEYEYGQGAASLFEVYNNKGTFDAGDNIAVGASVALVGIDAQLVAGEHDVKYIEGVTIPTISGTPQVGSTLTTTAGTWTPAGITATYQWFRGEQPIAGATAPTYTLTAADQGQSLFVLVNASYPGYEDRMNMSNVVGPIAAAPAPVVAPAPAPAPVPVISFSKKIDVKGALKVGSTLKLKNYKALVTQSTATATYKIKWFAGSKKIKKATKPKLLLTKALKGKKISVKVTAKVGTTTKSIKLKVGKVR